jgi:hypothetical protein
MSLVTAQAEMLASSAGDLQGVGSAAVAEKTGRSHSGASKRVLLRAGAQETVGPTRESVNMNEHGSQRTGAY